MDQSNENSNKSKFWLVANEICNKLNGILQKEAEPIDGELKEGAEPKDGEQAVAEP